MTGRDPEGIPFGHKPDPYANVVYFIRTIFPLDSSAPTCNLYR